MAVLCLGALALLVVSLLNGVPLPGLTRPVPLPSSEPAHARNEAAAPPVAAGRTAAHPSPVAVIRSRGWSAARSVAWCAGRARAWRRQPAG